MKQRILAACLAALTTLQLAGCAGDKGTAPDPAVENPPATQSVQYAAPAAGGNALSDMLTPLAAQTQTTKWKRFALDPVGNYKLYAYQPAFMIYADIGYAGFSKEEPANSALNRSIKAINALSGSKVGAVSEDSLVEGGFLYVADDGTYEKHEYLLRDGHVVVDGTPYAVTQKQYAALKEAIGDSAELGTRGAQWLVYMNPTRVVGIQCTDQSGALRQMQSDNVLHAAQTSQRIDVISGSTYTAGAFDFSGMFRAVFAFDGDLGIQYTIAAKGTKLYIESSDMAFGCEYTADKKQISTFIANMQELIDGRANPGTGKPVIYLYPEQTQDVEVKLDFQGQLCYTFPTYNGGWRVTARPDGTLTNIADGTTHYYLFWDGNAWRQDWDFSKGFVVKGSEVQAFFQEKLPQMGLTPREYNDFITYWTPELSANAYNLITFSTTQYEQTAPLTVTPAPDTVLRVHMVYKPLSAPIAVEEQVLPAAPARSGFTVVEWGGTRAFGMTK